MLLFRIVELDYKGEQKRRKKRIRLGVVRELIHNEEKVKKELIKWWHCHKILGKKWGTHIKEEPGLLTE